MFVPMSVNDFIDRAAAVYGDRLAVVDEPDPRQSRETLLALAGLVLAFLLGEAGAGVMPGADAALTEPAADPRRGAVMRDGVSAVRCCCAVP